jgi:5-formyltetrahydrofolate cyclo-ligase
VIAAREAVPAETRAALAVALHHQLLALPEVRAARRVLVYAARGAEVSVAGAARALLAAGVEVGVPRVSGDDLLPCPIRAWDDLVPGAFGIGTSMSPPWDGPIDVVVAPGVAFDAEGGRLGLGRGFYDRLLAGRAVGWVVGVCWDAQLVPRVPRDPHDRPVDVVVTPTRVLAASRARS